MSKETASASKAAAAADSSDTTARENAAAGTAATAPAPDAAASASAAADAADEDDPSNCPICAYIESGPCADPHVGWRLCKRDAKAEPGGGGGDWVERCEAQVCACVCARGGSGAHVGRQEWGREKALVAESGRRGAREASLRRAACFTRPSGKPHTTNQQQRHLNTQPTPPHNNNSSSRCSAA